MEAHEKDEVAEAADWLEEKYDIPCPEVWLVKGRHDQWGYYWHEDGIAKMWISDEANTPLLALFHEFHHHLLWVEWKGFAPPWTQKVTSRITSRNELGETTKNSGPEPTSERFYSRKCGLFS